MIELLKDNHIPFRFKEIVSGYEVDFIIGGYAVEIDGHTQDGGKNNVLFESGYIPIHFTNDDIFGDTLQVIKNIRNYGRN